MSKPELDPHGATLEADARALRSAVSELVRVYGFRDRDRICCHDVSVSQCHALEAAVVHGPLTLNALAAELYLDKSTASRLVDGLEAKGYVVRGRNPDSRRSILIEATPAGAALHTRIQQDLIGQEMTLLADFEPEVRQASAHLVARLAQAAGSRIDTSGGTCRGTC